MTLLVCGYTVHTPSILLSSAWSNRFCWWRSRIQVFVEKGKKWQFSTILSIALTHAGIEIHGSSYYHAIGWFEEYWHAGCTGLSCLLPLCEFVSNEKSLKIGAKIEYVRWAGMGGHRIRNANSSSREYMCFPVIQNRGTLGHAILYKCNRHLKMAVWVQKRTKNSLFVFSCTEFQSVGLLSSMTWVHLLVHVRWYGQLVPLVWAVAVREENVFMFSQ